MADERETLPWIDPEAWQQATCMDDDPGQRATVTINAGGRDIEVRERRPGDFGATADGKVPEDVRLAIERHFRESFARVTDRAA